MGIRGSENTMASFLPLAGKAPLFFSDRQSKTGVRRSAFSVCRAGYARRVGLPVTRLRVDLPVSSKRSAVSFQPSVPEGAAHRIRAKHCLLPSEAEF